MGLIGRNWFSRGLGKVSGQDSVLDDDTDADCSISIRLRMIIRQRH